MSRENVEIVRRSFEAFARGDFESAFAAHGPDTAWCTAADEPDQQTYHGLDGLREFVASLDEAWEGRFDGLMEFEDFIDCGDWVVAPWRARMHGRRSGIEVDVEETYAIRVMEGRIVKVEEFRSTDQALEAVA
jgi:ketosteroid isomerase-like protein